jgi:plasmid stabilization system protein ParE
MATPWSPRNWADTRELLFPPLPYIAVYRLKAETIEILRIRHAAQDRS